MRLDCEGPDAGVGLVFIRDTTPEKSNNCVGGVGTGRDWEAVARSRGSGASVQTRGSEATEGQGGEKARGSSWASSGSEGWSPGGERR